MENPYALDLAKAFGIGFAGTLGIFLGVVAVGAVLSELDARSTNKRFVEIVNNSLLN